MDYYFNDDSADLQPITAGLAGRLWGWWKKYTSAERRANAAEQLRDRFGRFAEMGRDHKFKFRNSSGATENATGIYVGPASRKGYGRFYVKDHPTLGTGIVEVSNKNFREILTSLSEDYLQSRGIKLGEDTRGNIVGARKDTDIPNIDDLNIQKATAEDLEVVTSKVEDMPDLEEVIKNAESGSIKYGDLKAGVIVRDEAGNRLGIVTQVDFINGKVIPLIRWQDGERSPGVESDPEDLLTIWVPAEDADSAEGNKEKASVKARLKQADTSEAWTSVNGVETVGDSPIFDDALTDTELNVGALEDLAQIKTDYSEMPFEQRDALFGYTLNEYDPINSFLRGRMGDPDGRRSKYVSQIDDAFKSSTPIKYGRAVFRGMLLGNSWWAKKLENMRPGDVWSDVGYTSTSINPGVARSFSMRRDENPSSKNASNHSVADKYGTVFFAINLPAGAKALNLSQLPEDAPVAPIFMDYDDVANESEILLPRGATFKIKGIRRVKQARKDGLPYYNYYIEADLATDVEEPQFMAFEGGKTVTVAKLKKGNSVVIGGDTLKVKSKTDLKNGTFRIEFVNDDGEVVEERFAEPTDTFDLPAKEKVAKPAKTKRIVFLDSTDPATKPKFGDVLLFTNNRTGKADEVYYISHEQVKDAKGNKVFNTIVERASDNEVLRIAIPAGAEVWQKLDDDGKKVNRASQVTSDKPKKPVEDAKPAPATPPLSAEENKPSQGQLESINRRINEGRYPGIVSESEVKRINNLLANATKGQAGIEIKKLNEAELKWRMDNGWSVEELIAKEYTKKDGTVALPTRELDEQYSSYKPYKDENGKPIPGVEQPTETEGETVSEAPENPLPTSGEIGSTGVLRGRVRYEVREDGSIYIFDDNSIKSDEKTFNHKDTIRGVGFQRDRLGSAPVTQVRDSASNKFLAWKITPEIGQLSLDKLSMEDFRIELLQRLFNRINGINDPNDVISSVAQIPDGEVSDDASEGIQGEPGETGSLGNGVGFSINKDGNPVIFGDLDDGSENLKLVTSVLAAPHDGYGIITMTDRDDNLILEVNPKDRSVSKAHHVKSLLNAIKEALSFSTEEEPEPEAEAEQPAPAPTPAPSPSVPPTTPDNPPTPKQIASVERRLAEEGVVTPERAQEIRDLLPSLTFDTIGDIIQELDRAQLKKRMANNEDIDDIRVPQDMQEEVRAYLAARKKAAEDAADADADADADTPAAQPEPQGEEDEEEEEKDLVPDRELEIVQGSEIIFGDLLWDRLRGFAKVVSQPVQDEKDPNSLLAIVNRGGDSKNIQFRIRKNAKMQIAKRPTTVETPKPTPSTPEKPQPEQPTPTPTPTTPEKPAPKPDRKPRPSGKVTKTTRVYFMDPNGTGKPTLFSFVAWNSQEDRDRLLARFREIEATRRADFDRDEEFGLNKEPYKPLFLFEDGFEFSSDAGTKKQFQSVIRRLELPGLMSDDEIKKISADLGTMTKSQLFDLINKLDGLEIQWRMDNGYPISDLIQKRVPRGFDMSKTKGYVPTKSLSDLPPSYVESLDDSTARMEFSDRPTIGTNLGIRLLPATTDAWTKDAKPSPGAFTGSLLDAVQGKNWAEVLDFIKNLETPIFFFDTETTGISTFDGDNQPNNAVQVGIIKVVKGQVVERFNIYLNPDAPLGKWSAKNLQRDIVTPQGEIIGSQLLTDEWLSEQMDTAEAVRQMIDFMGNNPIIGGQNVPFDLEVFQRMLDKAGVTDFSVAGTVDSKDLIDAIIPKYDPDTGVDGPKKRLPNGQYVSTTSLGYVAKFLGFDTTKWHSADADAEDSFRLVMRSLEMGAENPDENLWALDKESLAQRYREAMNKLLAALSPNKKATARQRGTDTGTEGFRTFLEEAGFDEDQRQRILAPIKKMTRGQAAEYISNFIKDTKDTTSQEPLASKLRLQKFIDSAASEASNIIPAGSGVIDVREVTGPDKKNLIKIAQINKNLRVDPEFKFKNFMLATLGSEGRVDRILANADSPENKKNLEAMRRLFDKQESEAASPENMTALAVGDANFIVYNNSDGVEVTPEQITKLATMITKVREIAPIGNNKLRVSLITNEEMAMLKGEDVNDMSRSAFFTWDADYLHIVLRKEAFSENSMDPRMVRDKNGNLTLHSQGNMPESVLTFLHEYGHAYHAFVLGSLLNPGGTEVSKLAKEFEEKFGSSFISTYGEDNNLEKFADLFFDYLYSKLTNRDPANPEFTKFIDSIIADKTVKPETTVKRYGKKVFKKLKQTYLPSAVRKSTIRGVDIPGIVEVTGSNLTDLERSMEGYTDGNWLAGTDANSGLIPSLTDANGNFNEAAFIKMLSKVMSPAERASATPEKLNNYRAAFKKQVQDAIADTTTYRVFQVDGTNQFIRVKDAVADPEIIASAAENIKTLTILNNLGNIPTYYTIFPNRSFMYDNEFIQLDSDGIGIAGMAKTSNEYGIFFGLNAASYGMGGVQLPGTHADNKGAEADDRFSRTTVHEYGHGIADVFMGSTSMPLYQDFAKKFGDNPLTTYAKKNVKENFAEYFYALFMSVTKTGTIPDYLKDFADWFNEKIAGKNPINQRPRKVVDMSSLPSSSASSENFPEVKEDADVLSEFAGRRSFYENGLTPSGSKLDKYDSSYITSTYLKVLAAENSYLSAKNDPDVSDSAKELAKLKFVSQVGALKAAYDAIVLSGGDKYNVAKDFKDPKFQFMNFSEGWKDDDQGYPVIWDSYEDMPITYADPLDREVFNAEERSALKNYAYTGWRWISSLLSGKKLSPVVSDMTEAMLRGLSNAFSKPEAKLTRNMYLYHGSTGKPGDAQHDALIDAKPGDEITLPSFSSTSMSPTVAYDDFGPGSASTFSNEEGFFLIIRAPKGSNAIVMPQGLAYRDGEREVLLNARAKLRVLEVSRSPRLDSGGFEIPNAFSTYIEADLVSTEALPDRGFETPAGATRDLDYEQSLDYLTLAYAQSFNRGLDIFVDPEGGLGSSNSVIGYVRPYALDQMPGNLDLDNEKVDKMVKAMVMGSVPTKPIIVSYNPETKTAFVLDGNHRVAAALEAGMPFLPVIVVPSDVYNPDHKKIDKGWAIPPFGIDETGTSEKWPEAVHPYFIFDDTVMLSPAISDDEQMFMQFESSMWSSKIADQTGKVQPRFRPEEGPLDGSSQYEFEQLHPGSYVVNKKTGKIGVVYGDLTLEQEGGSGGLIVKYLEGALDSYPEGFFIDSEFDAKGVRRVESGSYSASGYNDIRFYTLKLTKPSEVENVTDDFITPGTDGILIGDTMFGIIKDTNKRGKIVGFPAKGVVTIAITNPDGSHSFEKIPISKFLPIQRERPSENSQGYAEHNPDMLPTRDDLDRVGVLATNLYRWGYLPENRYQAIIQSVKGRFLTKAGTRDLIQYLSNFESLRTNKIAGVVAKPVTTPRKRLEAPVEPAQPAPTPQNVGNMTINEFLDYLNRNKVPGATSQFMQFDGGEENTSPAVQTTVTTNPPSPEDLRMVQNILQESGVIPDLRAKDLWNMLSVIDADMLAMIKNDLLTALLYKRIANEEPISGIPIPDGFDKSKLAGYLPSTNLDGSPFEIPVAKKLQEVETMLGELSDEQKWLYNHLESTNSPVFITGKAGTGKSFLLKFFKNYSEKNVAVVAPTGVAAENIEGTTIHSLFGLKIDAIYGETEASKLLPGSPVRRAKIEKNLRALNTLVVDEVSMVSADLLDAMDRILRYVKKKPFTPFGGVQFVGFGDVYQLPPVVDQSKAEMMKYMQSNYMSPFFFDARAWVDQPLEVYELSQVFRQTDPKFKSVLNNIRVGRFSKEDIDFINDAGMREVPASVENLINAVSTNPIAKRINDEEMAKLGNVKSATYSGEFKGTGEEAFGGRLPAPKELMLKVGAQVMFTKNDLEKSRPKDAVDQESGQGLVPSRRWVNGTIGIVVDLTEDTVKVKVGDNIYDVKAEEWEKIGYNVSEEVDSISNRVSTKLSPQTEATYSQIPLILAWASTIHKLQGKTIQNLKVDLGDKAFAPGQLYTALSRVTSIDGLYLARPIRNNDVIVDGNARRFSDSGTAQQEAANSEPSFMMFGGEPFDPTDPNLDLDKELNYDFTSGPYGIPLLEYQEDMMKTYADMIAQAEKQFGSNSNRVKALKSTRREHYNSYFARPGQREDNIMDKATENLKIDLEGSVTEEYDNPSYRDFKTTTTASYKDRYGRQYRFEGVVSLQELYYGEPGKLQTYIEVKAYDLAGNTDEAVANMSTEWGDIQDGPLLDNQVYIANIETKEEYQRRYLATGLLAFASQLTDKKILHSDKLTNMGYAFMSSVEMDESRKTIDYPSLAESQDDREKVMVIDITKLSKTKSSAEITDLLQRLNADQIPYKLKY